ncbi:MAG TPA: dihydrofolate reductase family protein [Solirubrobacteraceae bacterium]
MQFRQLLPEPAPVDIAALLSSLALGELADEERPYVVANFIASADGRATFMGKSGQLGDPADRYLFHGLREQVDAVFAGTRTLMIERYGRIIRDEEGRRRREQRGLSPEPFACVVTRSGEVPTDIPLFSESESRIVLFSAAPVDVSGCAAQVELVSVDPGELTLTTVLRTLRSDFGVASLLCEGGPTVFGSLLQEGLVDELFLTLAPKLVGGGASPTITSGSELMELQGMKIAWMLEHEGALYLRYRLR